MDELSKATADFVQVSQQLRKMMKARMEGTKEQVGTEGAFLITELKNLNATAQLAKEKVINEADAARANLLARRRENETTLYRVAQMGRRRESELTWRGVFYAQIAPRLVSEGEFDAAAPPRLKEQAALSEHDRELARLEFELEQRKALTKMLHERKNTVHTLREQLEERRETVVQVEPGLEALLDSTKPLLQGLELEIATLGETIDFQEDPDLCDPMIALYRQCKMREANCGDMSCELTAQGEILVRLGAGKEVIFAFCPVVDRVFVRSSSSIDLDALNPADLGVSGRPNMFGEMVEQGEVGEKFNQWIQSGWKCYRWAQNIAGFELMLSDDELQKVPDLDAAISRILLL